jgi:pyruvate dehydrogenase E2 component (dihydrolipoamide acetyltransferase)
MADRVFAMPDLGEGLEEGEIVSWLVAEGDDVSLNQPLVEVETAKATVEIPSPYAGAIVTLHGGAGDAVAVGAPLVTFRVAGAGPEEEAAVVATELATAPADAPSPGSVPSPSGQIAATPAVRKLAKDLGVDLATIAGTGPGGRVTADDVRGAGTDGGDPTAAPDGDRIPVSSIRRTIARRLEQAAAIPQVTTFRTVDATALEAVRREREVSPLPIVVAALCRTIGSHPLLNASWSEDAILTHRAVHVGIAVDTERGLIVPVVRDAGARSIAEISEEIGRLAEAARAGTLHPDEVAGATISVSNTGSYGSEAGTPLLNPPNAVTVAIGVIAPRALVTGGGAFSGGPACSISLTFDHRVLFCAAAGRSLTALVAFM